MQEELDEIKEAIRNNDIIAISYGLKDLIVVTYGSILEFGLAEKFRQIFDNIHHSNMSKACSTIEEAEQTIEWYRKNKGVESYWIEKGGKYIVYRTEDNNVLKSIN